MEWIRTAVDLFLHLDKHLGEIIQQYGGWTYAILTLVVFCETGLVVTPFLPGDSLLFAAGALAALPDTPLRVGVLFLLLTAAAILGDTVNYWIGNRIGPRAFDGSIRFLKKSHLDRTHEFYEKYGAKTIIIARFVPIVRTFAPFVAGVGSMTYGRFFTYNVVGGVLWVAICLFAGYFFGNLPFVKANFSIVILAIIAISVMPAVVEIVRHRLAARRAPAADAPAVGGD
jgi:membrane-associated protein